MKILFQVVDEVFQKNPKIVEDAKTMKSAYKDLTDLVIKEFDGVSRLDLDSIFSMIKEKMAKKM